MGRHQRGVARRHRIFSFFNMTDEKTCMEAYRSGFTEGQKHLEPSPETLRILTEIKTEWAQLKTRALYALVTSLAVAVGYGVWVGTIQSRLDDGERTNEELSESVSKIDGQQRVNDIALAGIKAELASINATLLEIKSSLKRL